VTVRISIKYAKRIPFFIEIIKQGNGGREEAFPATSLIPVATTIFSGYTKAKPYKVKKEVVLSYDHLS